LKNNNQKNLNTIDNEQFLRVKNELQNAKHQLNILSKENFKLKKDNEILLKEKNKYKSDLLVLEGNKKFEDKKNETEIKRLNNSIDNLKEENSILRNSNKEKDNEIKKLYTEKINLSNNLSNKELQVHQLLNEINILNDLLKDHQDELEKNLVQNYKSKKESQLRERMNEESYKKEIEDLKYKLKGNMDFDKIEEILSDKDNEIHILKNKILEIETNTSNEGNLIKKYNDMVTKKNLYKKKCREANEKIEKLLRILNPEQEEEFKKIFGIDDKNKND
jgi:chromosome segregation ATPase